MEPPKLQYFLKKNADGLMERWIRMIYPDGRIIERPYKKSWSPAGSHPAPPREERPPLSDSDRIRELDRELEELHRQQEERELRTRAQSSSRPQSGRRFLRTEHHSRTDSPSEGVSWDVIQSRLWLIFLIGVGVLLANAAIFPEVTAIDAFLAAVGLATTLSLIWMRVTCIHSEESEWPLRSLAFLYLVGVFIIFNVVPGSGYMADFIKRGCLLVGWASMVALMAPGFSVVMNAAAFGFSLLLVAVGFPEFVRYQVFHQIWGCIITGYLSLVFLVCGV